MTEDEKRALALSFMKQEQQRLSRPSFTVHTPVDQNRIAANQAVFSRLAQQGITWQQLKAAYDEAFSTSLIFTRERLSPTMKCSKHPPMTLLTS